MTNFLFFALLFAAWFFPEILAFFGYRVGDPGESEILMPRYLENLELKKLRLELPAPLSRFSSIIPWLALGWQIALLTLATLRSTDPKPNADGRAFIEIAFYFLVAPIATVFLVYACSFVRLFAMSVITFTSRRLSRWFLRLLKRRL